MELSSPCDYKLILFDDGGDSWGSCWLGIQQEDSLWQFRIDQNNVYSDTFLISFNAYDEIFLYYFEIPTPQQNAQQLDIQTIQNSFKIENTFGTIIHEGNNPWANVDNGTCVYDVACNPGQQLLEVAILLDNWPGETSWEIAVNGIVTYSVPAGTYDYTQTGQTVSTDVCVPIGATVVVTIYDSFGEGIGC